MRGLGLTLCTAAVTRGAWWLWEHADLDWYASALVKKGWAHAGQPYAHAAALLHCAVDARCSPHLMAFVQDLPDRVHGAGYVGAVLTAVLYIVGALLARARGRALTVELPGARLQRPVKRSYPRGWW